MPTVNVTYDDSNAIVKYIGVDEEGKDKYQVFNPGDVAWVLACSALVWIMVPGVGFFYSGLLRRKNALSMIHLSMLSVAVVSFQWWLWGFSLAFSDDANVFIGTLKNFALRGVSDSPSIGSNRIPSIVFCIYQCMFAAITPCLAIGAIAERGRIGPSILFIFLWTTLVYDPIACWTWNSNGWSYKLGILDYAGGTPVHISSGTAALAISIYLGKRRGYGTERLAYKPHNTTYVVLGTVLLWFGWFGFNGGSGLAANMRAANVMVNTNLAASVSGLTWMAWDWRLERKWSAVGFCSGAIAGLVAITPGCGYVNSPSAVVFGVAAGTICNFATQLKYLIGVDECLDIFASHSIGGIVGNVLTGLFAEADLAAWDGFSGIKGGWIDHYWRQLGIQLADSCAGFGWSLVVTTIILWAMHLTPWTRLRATEDAEILGIDDAEMGEFAYDYVGLEAELLPKEQHHDGAVGGQREPQHAHYHAHVDGSPASGSDNGEKVVI